MWAIISNHKDLRFFSYGSLSAKAIEGVGYEQCQKDGSHEQIARELLISGIPLFIKKSDARDKALEWGLTGYKYIEISPAFISLGYLKK